MDRPEVSVDLHGDTLVSALDKVCEKSGCVWWIASYAIVIGTQEQYLQEKTPTSEGAQR